MIDAILLQDIMGCSVDLNQAWEVIDLSPLALGELKDAIGKEYLISLPPNF
jgi:hypothetical protein